MAMAVAAGRSRTAFSSGERFGVYNGPGSPAAEQQFQHPHEHPPDNPLDCPCETCNTGKQAEWGKWQRAIISKPIVFLLPFLPFCSTAIQQTPQSRDDQEYFIGASVRTETMRAFEALQRQQPINQACFMQFSTHQLFVAESAVVTGFALIEHG
jgi:hypothetical protein